MSEKFSCPSVATIVSASSPMHRADLMQRGAVLHHICIMGLRRSTLMNTVGKEMYGNSLQMYFHAYFFSTGCACIL
jgi:hypothetical protein